jgi:hypothetical protein
MSISGVSSNPNAYQSSGVQSNFKQVRQDFRDLASALQSGDLSGAQNAFAALQQLMQNAQPSSQSQSQGNSKQDQFSIDLAAIGKALQSGDLNSAQHAFTKLQQDIQAVQQGGHHRRHHAHGAQGANNAINSTTGASANGATDSDGDHDGSVGKGVNATA